MLDAIETIRERGHRACVVMLGSRQAAIGYSEVLFSAADIGHDGRCLISDAPTGIGRTIPPAEMDTELGRTHRGVAVDATDGVDPDVLGQAVGTVDGGGICLVWMGPRSRLQTPRGRFAASMAVPPWTVDAVGTQFIERIVRTASQHPQIGLVDLDTPVASVPPAAGDGPHPPPATTVGVSAVDPAVSDLVRTADQRRAVDRICQLPPGAVAVVDARRGRGKSSALAIAAVVMARRGARVQIAATARAHLSAVEALLDAVCERDRDGGVRYASGGSITVAAGGLDTLEVDADILIIDEAATVPIDHLWRQLGDHRVVFSTTTDGYEGTGAGFGVRLAARLRTAGVDLHHIPLSTPIRFAADDPLERWITRLLCLDAVPLEDIEDVMALPPVQLGSVTMAQLADDEALLRGVRALLASAHYQTTAADLARWLDAPNIQMWTAQADRVTVGVVATAEEGRLDGGTIETAIGGQHIPGQLLPDVFMRQFGDRTIGRLHTRRIMRVAVHPELRRRGIGTALIDAVDAPSDADALTATFGATVPTLRFWAAAGFVPVHVAARPNARSGVHSVFMVRPRTTPAERWTRRAQAGFIRRLPGLAPDHLRRMDPLVLSHVCAAADPQPLPELSAGTWRQLRRIGGDESVYATAPHAVRRLLIHWLTHHSATPPASAAALAVGVACQGRPMTWAVEAGHVSSTRQGWSQLADTLGAAVDMLAPTAAGGAGQRWAK